MKKNTRLIWYQIIDSFVQVLKLNKFKIRTTDEELKSDKINDRVNPKLRKNFKNREKEGRIKQICSNIS